MESVTGEGMITPKGKELSEINCSLETIYCNFIKINDKLVAIYDRTTFKLSNDLQQPKEKESEDMLFKIQRQIKCIKVQQEKSLEILDDII
jgi:hypothetical protein